MEGNPLAFTPISRKLRARARIFNPAGSNITHIGYYFNNQANPGVGAVSVPANSEVIYDVVVDQTANSSGWQVCNASSERIYGGASFFNQTFYIKDIEFTRLGAVAHYDADLDGVGLQLRDQLPNRLDATITATGASWTKPATVGYFRARSDGTTGAQQLGGGTLVPGQTQLLRIRARSITGTPSITLGSASGGSQFVASIALSTTWQTLTIALTGGINTTAAAFWMTASTANVVEVQAAYEQLPL